MAIIDDSNNNMSTKEIKDVLINTFKRSAEKSVHEASYDKTILATIQYCIDSTIGQYKIKYQNGYFTAYSRETDIVYANKASVYVVVPGNNMSNKLFITGLASDDSSQRISMNNLEGDQQYAINGSDFITNTPTEDKLAICSYWSADQADNIYVKTLYDAESEDNILTLDTNGIIRTLSNGGEYLRIGASFKTDLLDHQLNLPSANYGITVIIRYKNENDKEKDELKSYTIDTFNMRGNPFHFNTYVPQYKIYEIDLKNFIRIEKIEEFCSYFEEEDPKPDPDRYDIFVKDISIFDTYKKFDKADSPYTVSIVPNGSGNTFNTENTILPYEMMFEKMGIQVTDPSVNYYWAKEDASVDTSNHKKYCEHTGIGWYCLNEFYFTSNGESTQSTGNMSTPLSQLEGKTFSWNSEGQNKLNLQVKIFPGQKTRIKGVVVYENATYISKEVYIYNDNGKIIVINNSNGDEHFYSGNGTATLTAGVFKKRKNSSELDNFTFNNNIRYHWAKIDNFGNPNSLPPDTASERYYSYAEWDQHRDNVNVSQADVEVYLNENPLAKYCYERFTYYNKVKNSTDDQYTEAQKETAKTRCDAIVEGRLTQIETEYTAAYNGSDYDYILGPSLVNAQQNEEGEIEITEITPYYYGTNEWNTYKDFKNTILSINAKNINTYAIYKVTVTETDNDGFTQAIGTEQIVLYNDNSGNLKYDLRIMNGDRAFPYSEEGYAPTSDNYNYQKISLTPLTFQLFDEGTLIYDSSKDDLDDVNSTISIESLKPTWKFFSPSCSLIQTEYKGGVNCTQDTDDPNLWIVTGQRNFIYKLANTYTASFADKSNVQLQVIAPDGTIVNATTNFVFSKQGDLNTNGTSMFLKIFDQNYQNYKDEVLTNEKYCKITEIDGTTNWYSPSQRHLNNTYLYATKCFDSSGNPCHLDDQAKYVNLLFAQRADTSHNYGHEGNVNLIGLGGDTKATLVASWHENQTITPIDRDSKWSVETFTKGSDLYAPSFNLEGRFIEEQSTMVSLTKIIETNEAEAYRPTKIRNFGPNSNMTRVAQNIVKLEAKRAVPEQIDPITNTAMIRSCYGYYDIPYFFYSCFVKDGGARVDLGALDPARHIVVVNGFDTITYNEAGLLPKYNQEEPFKLFFFDRYGKNITTNLVQAATLNPNIITWECSPGLSFKTESNSSIPTYASYAATPQQPLIGCYCRYGPDNKIYKCITNHVYSHGTITIPSSGKIYNEYDFIEPYWAEIGDYSTQDLSCQVIPALRYESLASDSLFNSWISVRVTGFECEGYVYEAEVLLPINVFCNRYGSEELNNWDGKKTKIEDAYILSNKVGAGVITEDNVFTGITIGETFYLDDNNKRSEIGLFGYGRPNANSVARDELTWNRTIFMDAYTGRTILGPSGSSQIVLNPAANSWSRLAGWYFHPNFLYKPVGEGDPLLGFDYYSQGGNIEPPNDTEYLQGSAGMYVPYDGTISASDVFLWASSKEKDLDLTEIEAELDALQATLASVGTTFGPGKYGQITNQAAIDTTYQNNITLFENLNAFILHCIDHKDYIDCGDTELWELFRSNQNKEYENILNILPATLYNPYFSEFKARGIEGQLLPFITDVYTFNKTNISMEAIERTYLAKELLVYYPDYYPDWSQKKIWNYTAITYKNWIDRYNNTKDTYDQNCSYYTILTKRYADLLESESQAKVVSYKDFNLKSSNFYVTYGGRLHAASADIEGKITATSGSFGTGSNKILISTVKDSKSYILYNKNFWVRDGSAGDPEIFMKGTIRAKAGQIGKVGNNVDGNSSNTLFIQYSWYPWHLPDEDEEWSAMKEDTEAGKTEKYALYNKKFFIKNNGEAVFNGNIYSKRGRIGDWVIGTNDLKDITGNIVLHPASSKSTSASNTYIGLGKVDNSSFNVRIKGDGSIEGPDWSISSTGVATFNNPQNTVRAKTVYIGGGASASSISSTGLNFPAGTQITLGSNTLGVGDNGFVFSGGVGFGGLINVSHGLALTNGCSITGADGLDISNTGIKIGSQKITPSNGYEGKIDSAIIGGVVLPQYIEDKIKAILRDMRFVTNVSPTTTMPVDDINVTYYDPQNN